MSAPTATTHDITVNGITLRVATWGTWTTPERAAMLVHGITASSQTWATFGPLLAARGWYAIAPDLRGRGMSEKPPHGYGIPYHVNDLLSLADHFNLPTINYVGHSLGAMIGFFLAAIHPQRVGRLMLVDAGGKLPPDTGKAIGKALARLGTPYSSFDAYWEAMHAPWMKPHEEFWRDYYCYDAETYPDSTVMCRVPRAAIAEEVATNSALNLASLSEMVRSPTLIARATVGMLGADRGLLLPREEAERLTRVIPASRFVEIPDTNHYTIVLADQFAEAATAFLEG
ncbi:MAG: alpha/beta hydrolase [Chloroflexota bacterium]|nr:alpha/beta hydrolase [Chloroflexota bacterium]